MDKNNKNNGPGNNRQGWGLILFTTLLVTFVVMGLYSLMQGSNPEEISYDKFLKLVDNGKVESVTMSGSQINIVLTDEARKQKQQGKLTEVKESGKSSADHTEDTSSAQTTTGESNSQSASLIEQLQNQVQGTTSRQKDPDYYTGVVSDDTLVRRLDKAGVEFRSKVPDTASSLIMEVVITVILPVVLLVFMFSFLMKKMSKGGGMMGIGKSNAKMYMEKQTGVTFQDVAGEDEAKESLQEVVDFLHNPGKYTGIGAKLPKGALLVGPPGTGKTLLAKAVAGEAKVPFFSLSGSAFVEMYVGVGASRVRDLFKQAQQMAPCIVFIDEIDAIGKTRDTAMGGGNDEREQTLNQLLAEMDGFDTNKGLLVLAATNRPEVLDPALLRPGRFDRRIIVDKPDLKGRVEILKVHAKDVRMDESVDLEAIALATSGAVGSDLANMINEAAINAVKHGRQVVSQKDLFEAVEVVLVGKEKKDRIMSPEERRIVSYHEVGHALVTALQKNTEPVQKITIVPRTMGALGYVMQTPEEEKFLNTKKELEAMIVVALGGRAAEEIVFDTVTTGASNDIEQATKIARAMITQYGMSERFGLMGLESVQHRYLDGRAVLNCGEATAGAIDEEVMKMLKGAYEEAKRLLSENREALDQIAAFLIEKETITGKEFMEIFRKVKGIPDPEESGTTENGAQHQEGRIMMKETAQTEQSLEQADSCVEKAEEMQTPEVKAAENTASVMPEDSATEAKAEETTASAEVAAVQEAQETEEE
nr:ATP-dependent zinc metalloprotease FtsH [uncultured Mediterraneibacter sp.]